MKGEVDWISSMCQMIVTRYPSFDKQLSKKANKQLVLDIYDSLPVLEKDIILDSLDCTIASDISSRKKLIYEMMNDDGMTRNHDKKIDNQWNIEFTTGTSGKRFPILKSARTKMIESKYLLRKRKDINQNATLNNAFLFLHTNQEMIRNMNLWEFKGTDLDAIGKALLARDRFWVFATPLIYKNVAQWLVENKKETELGDIFFCEYTSQALEPEKKKSSVAFLKLDLLIIMELENSGI